MLLIYCQLIALVDKSPSSCSFVVPLSFPAFCSTMRKLLNVLLASNSKLAHILFKMIDFLMSTVNKKLAYKICKLSFFLHYLIFM